MCNIGLPELETRINIFQKKAILFSEGKHFQMSDIFIAKTVLKYGHLGFW